MFDSHCHLHDDRMREVRTAAIERAAAAGVRSLPAPSAGAWPGGAGSWVADAGSTTSSDRSTSGIGTVSSTRSALSGAYSLTAKADTRAFG